MPANLENSAVGTGLERSVFIPVPKKGNAKECSNYFPIALTSHASKVIRKILQLRFQQYVNYDRYSSWIKKRQRNHRSRCQHLLDHRNSKRIPEKTFTSASLTMPKPLTVWITTNCGKFFKRCAYQNTLPPSAKPLCRSRSNS